MPSCQYHDFSSVVVIRDNMSPTSKFNHPIVKLGRQLFHRAANFRVLAEGLYALPDRLDCALGRIPTFWDEEVIETGHIQQGRLRSLQERHLGGATSLPASRLTSQTSASSAVA